MVEGPAAEVVAAAMEQFGGGLVGVLAFGSWARGDTTPDSDVDILVVLEADVPIVRSLYRPWDERRLEWDGRAVQVHLVHLPDVDELPTGLWAEAAMEGVILFERSFEVSRCLMDVRRRIAEGAISRREVHGQPYWVAED
jgi:predicted nucleotidyltransferase